MGIGMEPPPGSLLRIGRLSARLDNAVLDKGIAALASSSDAEAEIPVVVISDSAMDAVKNPDTSLRTRVCSRIFHHPFASNFFAFGHSTPRYYMYLIMAQVDVKIKYFD